MSTIRKMLGLSEEKADPTVTKLPPDYFDTQETKPEPLAAASDEEDDEDDDRTPEERAITDAQERLESVTLLEGSWDLIDRALDSLSRNTGAGLDDPDAVNDAKQFAALVKATDNDLSVLVQAIIASSAPADAAGNLYSALYRTMKNVVFFANLDYRQAQGLDAYSDEAVVQAFFDRYVSSTYVDEALSRVVDDKVLSSDDVREKEQEDRQRSDQGFEARRELELQYLFEKYSATDIEDAVVQAVEDIQLLFQLNVEALGWPPERPMPFGNVQNPDGSFTPISDARTALDAAEIARQASQKKRREKRTAMLTGAAAAAAAIVHKSLQRPTVHRRK